VWRMTRPPLTWTSPRPPSNLWRSRPPRATPASSSTPAPLAATAPRRLSVPPAPTRRASWAPAWPTAT